MDRLGKGHIEIKYIFSDPEFVFYRMKIGDIEGKLLPCSRYDFDRKVDGWKRHYNVTLTDITDRVMELQKGAREVLAAGEK